MNEEEQKNILFQEGLSHYRSKDYFEAHESWEDLWSDYYLEDRKFVQGLIQLAVCFVHLENGNMNGAKSLLNKCTYIVLCTNEIGMPYVVQIEPFPYRK